MLTCAWIISQTKCDPEPEMFGQVYGIPPELMEFVYSGLLEVLVENEPEKTIEFHIPSLRTEDFEGRITTYSLCWIHPEYNARFCHFSEKTPGDLPNFYVVEDTTDLGEETVGGLGTVGDLVEWLSRASELAAV